jgi:hypothetical protein
MKQQRWKPRDESFKGNQNRYTISVLEYAFNVSNALCLIN